MKTTFKVGDRVLFVDKLNIGTIKYVDTTFDSYYVVWDSKYAADYKQHELIKIERDRK